MVRLLNASVPEFEILELALLIVIVPPEGDKFPEAPTVKVPATENELAVDVVPLNVTLLKVNAPEFEIEPPVKVIVPADGANVEFKARLKAETMEKLEEVETVAPEAIERF